MRGEADKQATMFSYISPEARVPATHPLRSVKHWVDKALAQLSPSFEQMYSHTGRPSIAPEILLKSQLLIAFFSVRSERLFCEMLDYNLLFRWFLDIGMEGRSFDATTFTKNRDRLIEHETVQAFFREVVALARAQNLLSDDHFSVDGTIIEAWASMKRFQAKDPDQRRPPTDNDPSNPTYDFRGEKRSNDTHESQTDPDCRLYKKARNTTAQLCYLGHTLMENRNGFIVDTELTLATGTAEVDAAQTMVERNIPMPTPDQSSSEKSVGADKAYHQQGFVRRLIEQRVAPHIARKDGVTTEGLDDAITATEGYKLSLTLRKRIEEGFGWMKTIGGLYKVNVRGRARVGLQFALTAAAYNLIRLANLCPAGA